MNALVVTSSAVCSDSDVGDIDALLRRCRIPVSYRSSLSWAQILSLRAAEECLSRSEGYDGESTGVLVGLTGSTAIQRRNAMRIACSASRLWSDEGVNPDEAVDAVLEAFGSGPQDKIGEMASSIPARLAVAFRLRGRVLALDAHETTVAAVFSHALLLLENCVTALLLVFVDEPDNASDMRAWSQKTCMDPGVPREGQAVAMLVRNAKPHDVLPRVLGARIRRRPCAGPHRYPDEEESRELLGGSDVRCRFSGPVRVTDLALSVMNTLDECGEGEAEREVVVTSVSGAAAVVHVAGGACDVDAPEDRAGRGVAIAGAGAWFASAQGRKAFDRICEPLFADLGNRLPRQLRSEGNMRVGRSYCALGAAVCPQDIPVGGFALQPARERALGPMHLLALHVCREAVDNAGVDLSGRNGMVVVGMPIGVPHGRLSSLGSDEADGMFERLGNALGGEAEISLRLRRRLLAESLESGACTAHSIDARSSGSVAAFVADGLGLAAVPLAVEAACASSLAALDVAARALRAGEVGYVLVCGVDFPAWARDLVLCSELGMLSRTAMTPFSEAADGFLPGDGAGAVLLLPDEELSGDAVRVLGVGGSCDARSMLAPDVEGQKAAMRAALVEAGVKASTVGYIEAHGTGTVRGDTVELDSLAAVYGPGELCIGSVKSYIGHAFSAAGMAGLLRAEAAAGSGMFPSSHGLTDVDRQRLRRRGVYVPSQREPFTRTEECIRRTAVSAFGTGGINYHVVLEGGKNDETAQSL